MDSPYVLELEASKKLCKIYDVGFQPGCKPKADGMGVSRAENGHDLN